MTPTWVQLGYLVAAVLFILSLKGLSSPKSARMGTLLGAVGALLAQRIEREEASLYPLYQSA